ncbi:MAG: Trm112 family protein [Pseudomonadota bacterium]
MADDEDPGAEGEGSAGAGSISRRLLESLVCPATGSLLTYDDAAGELISKAASLAYPIRSGIPIMLIDEARKIEG